MAFKLNGYKVFIASPSGLENERRAFALEIEEYNKAEALYRDVIFQTVGWEDTLPGIGRPQSLINEELKQCDFFVLLLHDRWGSDPGKSKKKASSGTEEEYKIALDCLKSDKYPMRQIVCFFKSIPVNQLADPGPQLQKVLEFKKKLEDKKQLLFSAFSSIEEFKSLLRRNLASWLRNLYNGLDNDLSYIIPSSPTNAQLNIGSELMKRDEIIMDSDSQKTIDNAWKLANEGKLTDAEIEFSRALINNPRENQLLNYSDFLIVTGQLDKALLMIDRALDISNSSNITNSTAIAYSFKGIVLQTRGDLDGAEEMYKKSLAINEELEHLKGMASDYGNLGIVLKTRGDLVGAEEMYKKSLAINEKLERYEGMASDYGNLGSVLKTRGDLDGAEEMYKKSLAIEEKLGHLKGMANQYGNLGSVLKTRGDLDVAKEMYKKSLAIEEKLGHLKGMANQYGNLGIVLAIRGDLDGAEEMHKKSLAIEEKLGHLEGMASDYGNLGSVLKTRGDLDGAEEMYKKSLAIEEKLGHLEGMASQYGNLGTVLKTRGDLDGAEEMYNKSLAIEEKLGRLEGMASNYGNLGNVLQIRGDLDGAEEMYKKSLVIAKQVSNKQIIEFVNRNLKSLRASKK